VSLAGSVSDALGDSGLDILINQCRHSDSGDRSRFFRSTLSGVKFDVNVFGLFSH